MNVKPFIKPVNYSVIDELKTRFTTLLYSFDKSKSRYEVFKDFIISSACALRNSIGAVHIKYFSTELEDEYHSIQEKYSEDERKKFPELYALIILILDEYRLPRDVLGELFMVQDFGSDYNGQYFTPHEVTDLLVTVSSIQNHELIAKKGFVTVNDPTCGAGATTLAKVRKVIEQGYNPLKHMYVECTDLDRLVAMMCYIQLSLWMVPARIFVGNSLTLQIRETWITPAYVLGKWQQKLNH